MFSERKYMPNLTGLICGLLAGIHSNFGSNSLRILCVVNLEVISVLGVVNQIRSVENFEVYILIKL